MTLVGTWTFSYRTEITTDTGTDPTTTYVDMDVEMTFNANGTWTVATTTRTDQDPSGSTVTTDGVWDADDLSDGFYKLVTFGDREFLYMGDLAAYSRR